MRCWHGRRAERAAPPPPPAPPRHSARTRLAVLGHKDALDGAEGTKQLRKVVLGDVLMMRGEGSDRREGGQTSSCLINRMCLLRR